MTLLEVLIASAILVTVLSVVYMLLLTTHESYTTGSRLADIQGQSRIVLQQLAEELRQAGRSNIVVSDTNEEGDREIQFQVNTGYDGSTIIWSTPITYRSIPVIHETANDKDDDGNGLVDERRLVRIQDGDMVTLTNWLKEGTMDVSWNGSSVKITIELERMDPKRRPLLASGQTSVEIRNP